MAWGPGAVAALLAFALLGGAGPALAQEVTSTGPADGARGEIVRSPVLTIDADRLFSESLFGQRITSEIQAESESLAAENRRIASELEAEELELTQRRPEMSPEDFRAAAEEFDTRVQRIREEQDAKERAIGQRVQAAQEAFLNAVRPVLGRLMAERGAAVILDRRTVVLGVGAVDITEAAVERIDAEMGEGPSLQALDDVEPPSPDSGEEDTAPGPLEEAIPGPEDMP